VYEGVDHCLIHRGVPNWMSPSLAMSQTNPCLHSRTRASRADEIPRSLSSAATLLHIKQALLPRPPVHEPGEENIGED